MRLHVVDATFELFRAYFAVPSRRAPDGREVGAVNGLIGSMLSLLRQPEITHVGAATDHVIESFRNQLFDGYKTSEGVPDDLMAQFPLAEDALRAIGVTVWPMIEFEADDALATAATRYLGEVEQVVILSPDKDLAQCVIGDTVVTQDRMRGITYDEAAVRAKFGVPPGAVPDYLALVGDSADGYPGMDGIGEVSAARLIRQHGAIEDFPPQTLGERKAMALLFKNLATLRTDAKLFASVDELEWRGPTADFAACAARLGDARLTSRADKCRR